jgi:hypothetical protein
MYDALYRGNRDSRQHSPTRRLQRRTTVLGEVIALRGVGSDLTSWDPLFKEDYTNTRIMNTLNDENQIQDFMTTDVSSEGWQGRRKIVPVKVGRNHSTGSIGSRGALPQAGRSAYVDFQIPMRDVYGRVGFEEWVIKQSRNKKGAYAEVIDQEMTGMVEDLAFRRNVMGWLAGTGILALVNGTHTTATTLELKAPGNVTGTSMANRYLQGDATSGMLLAILDSSTQAIKGTATITACNTDGTDVTLDTAITAADGDYVVIAQTPTQNSYNKEPEGILAGIDDGTYVATYHGVSRTTYPIMKSYVLTSVGPLSLDAMQQPIDVVNIKVGKGVKVLGMEHAVRRAYVNLLEGDRRYTGADLSRPDGGTAAAKKPSGRRSITFGDIPFLVDRDAPYGMIFGIDPDSWVRYSETDGEWADDEGSILKWVTGYDEYTAFYRIFENYHCHFPARNFRMEGITVNQIAARSF